MLLLIAAGSIWLLIELGHRVGEVSGQGVAEYVKSMGMWGHVLLVGLMIVHSFIPFPAELVAIAAGMCFGVVWGVVLTWVGAMIGAVMAFALSRYLGRPFVAAVMPERQMQRIDDWSRDKSTSALIVVRLIPVIAFNLVNYAAGLTRVSLWAFLWTTAIGILPMTVLMVIMGEQMREPEAADWFILAATGLLLLAVVHVVRRHGSGDAPTDS